MKQADWVGPLVPVEVLRTYGCLACVWKGSPLCPQGFVSPEQTLPEGYCEEFAGFVAGLGVPGDGLSAIKQKLVVYGQELQAVKDRQAYLVVQSQLAQAIASGADKDVIAKLRAQVEGFRIYWERLSAVVAKSLGQMADRERRSQDVEKSSTGSAKITVQQLNILLKSADKKESGDVIEDKKSDFVG